MTRSLFKPTLRASAVRGMAALAVALSLAACGSYATLVEPGTVEVQGKATVQVPAKWNKMGTPAQNNPAEVWVREGWVLDRLEFRMGFEPGRSLLNLPNTASEQTKEGVRARANMTPEQIVEMLSLVTRGGDSGQFKATKIEPATVMGQRGVRVEFSTVSQGSEVEYKGIAYGASGSKDMSLMVFQAAKVHYFQTLVADAEAIMKSAKLKAR